MSCVTLMCDGVMCVSDGVMCDGVTGAGGGEGETGDGS